MHLVKMIVTWPSDFHWGWGWKKHKRPPSRRQWENHGRPNLIRMDHMWNRDKISRWEGATLGPIPAVQRWHLDSQWQSTAENNNNRCLCCTFQKAVTKRFCSRFVHLETLDGKLGKNVTEQKGGGGWRHKTVRHANNNNNNNKGEESDQKTETDSASESSWLKKEAARRSCRTILVYTSVWFVPKTTFFSLKYVLRFWSLVQHTHTHTRTRVEGDRQTVCPWTCCGKTITPSVNQLTNSSQLPQVASSEASAPQGRARGPHARVVLR